MEERRNIWNPTQGGSNSWAYHREMDVEVSQYLETECRHSIIQWDCPFHDVVPWLSFSLLLGAWSVTSIAEWILPWRRIGLQLRCRRADPYCVLRKKGHFSFPTNRYLTTREGSKRRFSIMIRWRSVVTSAVFLTVCWTSVGLSEPLSVRTLSFLDPDTSSMHINGLPWRRRTRPTRMELSMWGHTEGVSDPLVILLMILVSWYDLISNIWHMFFTFFGISLKITTPKIDDRMKINHEFNYGLLDHLIIWRIEEIWLLNLFFDITI